MTGSELIRVYADYQAQNDAALDGLLRAVRVYAMSVTGDEDAAQETCTQVWRSLHRFDQEKGNFAGWVRVVAQNCERMRNRNKASRATIAVADDFLTDLGHRAEETARMPEALRELLLHGPASARELVSLACSTGDLYEAGKLLGMTTNQVRHQRLLIKKFLMDKFTTA